MKATLLGTGTSSGVPRIACDCAVCLSSDPRNKRLRCSLLVEGSGGNILVDTTPDLRLQSLRQGLRRVDAVLFTHPHVDHLYGLDELRSFCFGRSAPIPCYGDEGTLGRIRHVFDYAFKPVYQGMTESVPQLSLNSIAGPFELCGCPVEPLTVHHGRLPILAYRFGSFAYVTDCNAIPPASLGRLRGLEVLVLDALRHNNHPTHFTVAQALEVVAELRPRRAYLTHIAHDLDHEKTNAALPAGVELAYDGLSFEVA
ncbi:MAG: MBL fold metallo-hydrolase [Candidatus Handelsmanbacteria bacterium]|nr:MBL fold metallo-hydrolase [Candidatus Handelsmanbacteria bacterium]